MHREEHLASEEYTKEPEMLFNPKASTSNLFRRSAPRTRATVVWCIIAVLLLTQPRGADLAAVGLWTMISDDGSQSQGSGTQGVPQTGQQTQQNQGRAKDKPAEIQMSDPLETLNLAIEGTRLGSALTREGVTEAIKQYKAAFEVFKRHNIKMGMAATLFGIASGYYFLGRMHEALTTSFEALRYSEEAEFDLLPLRPIIEVVIGASYASLGEAGKALEFLNRAVPSLEQWSISPMVEVIMKSLGQEGALDGLKRLQPKFLAFALRNLGQVNMELGRKREAVGYLERALALERNAGSWEDQFLILSCLLAIHYSLGESKKALEYSAEVTRLARENGRPDSEPYGHLAFGAAYVSIGKVEQGIDEFNKALRLLRLHNDKSGEAVVLNNMGLIHFQRGDLDEALSYFVKSLKLSESSNEPEYAAYPLNNIANVYYRRGEILNSIRYLEEALTVSRRRKDKRLEATILSSMAISLSSSTPEYAIKVFKESVAAFREVGEPAYESEMMINVAEGYAMLGRYREALEALQPALESRRQAQDPRREGYVLREMGLMHNLLGDREEALRVFAEALSRLETAQDSVGQADLYGVMGAIHLSTREYERAGALLYKALAMARNGGLRQSEAVILAALGRLHEVQGDYKRAEDYYDEQVGVGESVRSSARIEELKTETGRILVGLSSPGILLKFRLGKLSEAFDLTERERARTFLDQLNNVRLDVKKGGDPQLVEQEQSLRLEMRSLEEKIKKERRSNPSSEVVKVMAANLKEKEDAYAALLIRLKASNPDYAQLQSFSPVPLKQIQGLLGGRTTLVSYFVTRDKTLAFVIGSRSFNAVEIPVKEADLRAEVAWFRSFASLRDPSPQSLKRLHGWLITPIRQYLKTDNVAIVPHGVLHYIPFAALADGDRYFGDEHAIHYLPSASVLPSIRRRATQIAKVKTGGARDLNHVLAVAQSRSEGLPALRYANEEAEAIAMLHNTQALGTGLATKAEFLKRTSASNVLHIAAHAELNSRSPLFSRILLSPHTTGDKQDSGALELREVYGLELPNTNLVVLSACETQMGTHSKGDDIVSLNRAFIYAGAPSVIASLWKVDDESTGYLMKAFYTHLKNGMSKAKALQAAQAETRKKYPHPYYWAGFVLTGDPGKSTTKSRTRQREGNHEDE